MEKTDTGIEELIEPMPVTLQARAALLSNLMKTQIILTAEIDKIKKQMLEEAGDREFAPMELDSIKVSIVRRKPPNRPDVVGLVKAGFKKEEFSETKTTLASLRKFADKKKWTDRQLQKFILPGEGSPISYVRCELMQQEENE
jgi:hypothetical protein